MSSCDKNILDIIPEDTEKVKLMIQGYLSKIKLLETSNSDLQKEIDHLKSIYLRQVYIYLYLFKIKINRLKK